MAGIRSIAINEADASLSSMLKSVYELPNRGSRRASLAVTRAVLEANPHLVGMSKIPEGTPIVVPEVPDVPRRTPSATSGAPTVTTLLELAAEALTSARATLAATHATNIREARETLDLMKSRELRTAAKEPELASRIEDVRRGSKETLETEANDAREHARMVDELDAALKEFAEALGSV
jgi:phage tail protein X